jgi:hypothetical protein
MRKPAIRRIAAHRADRARLPMEQRYMTNETFALPNLSLPANTILVAPSQVARRRRAAIRSRHADGATIVEPRQLDLLSALDTAPANGPSPRDKRS